MLGDYNPLIELTTKKDYKDCFKLPMLKVYKKQHCNNNNNLGISLSLCLLLTKLLASFRYIPHTILVCEEGEFDRL